jgi:hypothetical protein
MDRKSNEVEKIVRRCNVKEKKDNKKVKEKEKRKKRKEREEKNCRRK